MASLVLGGLLLSGGVIWWMLAQFMVPVDYSSDSRQFDECRQGLELEEILKVYAISIPKNVRNVHFCGQEDWSGTSAEISFIASEGKFKEFIRQAGVSRGDIAHMKAPQNEGRWFHIPKGTSIQYATIGTDTSICSNTVYVYAVEIAGGSDHVYLSLECTS